MWWKNLIPDIKPKELRFCIDGIIRYTTSYGSHISRSVNDCIYISKMFNCRVDFSFSGGILSVTPESTEEEIYDKWMNICCTITSYERPGYIRMDNTRNITIQDNKLIKY